MLARIAAAVAMVLVPVMIYVLLMGNLTALNYPPRAGIAPGGGAPGRDDRGSTTASRSCSRATGWPIVAARLHMHDPLQMYAVVDVPASRGRAPSNGIAFLGAFFHH